MNESCSCGWTPLHYSCVSGELNVVNALVTDGADLNQTNNGGSTSLHRAIVNGGELEIVKVLLAAGAEVNKTTDSGGTSPHRASLPVHMVTLRQ